jgi:hypothetical protein
VQSLRETDEMKEEKEEEIDKGYKVEKVKFGFVLFQ